MSLGQLIHVQFDTQPGFLRHLHTTVNDLQRRFGEALAVLPDPVGVDGGNVTRRGGRDVG